MSTFRQASTDIRRGDRAIRIAADGTPGQVGIRKRHVQVAVAIGVRAAAAAEQAMLMIGVTGSIRKDRVMVVAVMVMVVVAIPIVIGVLRIAVMMTTASGLVAARRDACNRGRRVARVLRHEVADVMAAVAERNAKGLARPNGNQALREDQGPGHEVEEDRMHRQDARVRLWTGDERPTGKDVRAPDRSQGPRGSGGPTQGRHRPDRSTCPVQCQGPVGGPAASCSRIAPRERSEEGPDITTRPVL